MKPRVYAFVLLLILPFQASLLNAISLGGIKPDLALAVLYIIGLLTTPTEGALAGIMIGLMQDIGSASLIGFTGLTRGIAGLASGLLGARVLDVTSPMIVLFLAVLSLAEGTLFSLFLQVTYGAVPFFTLVVGRLLPQALYTGVLGFFLLRLAVRRNVLPLLKRRSLQKEL